MIDKAKRNTLKNVAGIGVGAAAMATSTGALSQLANVVKTQSQSAIDEGQIDLVDIQISTGISAHKNELEVVLTNVGTVNANITDMTPAQITTARGKFDFNALFENGNVELVVGESIRIPMQHHAVVLNGSSVGSRSESLTNLLQQNVSITTDGDSLAAVNIVNTLTAVA